MNTSHARCHRIRSEQRGPLIHTARWYTLSGWDSGRRRVIGGQRARSGLRFNGNTDASHDSATRYAIMSANRLRRDDVCAGVSIQRGSKSPLTHSDHPHELRLCFVFMSLTLLRIFVIRYLSYVILENGL